MYSTGAITKKIYSKRKKTTNIFYLFYNKKALQFGLFALLTILFSFQWLIEKLFTDGRYWAILPQIFGNGLTSFTSYFPQVFAVFALVPLAFYIYKAPKDKTALSYQFNQYFFYFYYPIHFALLAYLAAH